MIQRRRKTLANESLFLLMHNRIAMKRSEITSQH